MQKIYYFASSPQGAVPAGCSKVFPKSSKSLPKVRLFKSLPKVRRRLLKSVLVRRYFETNTAINPYRFPSFHEDEELGPDAAGASPAREGEPGEASAG